MAPDSASPASHEPKVRCRLAHRNESANTFLFEFLAEGAANAVFRVLPCSEEKSCFVFEDQYGSILKRKELDNKVLRISKGKPKTLRYKEIMEGFEDEVLPLFRKSESQPEQEKKDKNAAHRKGLNLSINESFEEFVMNHQGVSISPEALHALIAELHTHCPHNRHIEPHHLEERGILLPDMSSESKRMAFTIEIKPKWLVQSPDAPRDAYLCRTCALHASRKAKKEFNGAFICPLVLASGNAPAIEQWLGRLLAIAAERLALSPTAIQTIIARALPYLTTGPGHKLLLHLRYLQKEIGKKVLYADSLSDFDAYCMQLAMTLRDCSLFIRIPFADKNAPIEAKLGDLDFKSINKLNDWYGKEDALIHGGWYLAMESEMEECWIAQGWKMHVPYYC